MPLKSLNKQNQLMKAFIVKKMNILLNITEILMKTNAEKESKLKNEKIIKKFGCGPKMRSMWISLSGLMMQESALNFEILSNEEQFQASCYRFNFLWKSQCSNWDCRKYKEHIPEICQWFSRDYALFQIIVKEIT